MPPWHLSFWRDGSLSICSGVSSHLTENLVPNNIFLLGKGGFFFALRGGRILSWLRGLTRYEKDDEKFKEEKRFSSET